MRAKPLHFFTLVVFVGVAGCGGGDIAPADEIGAEGGANGGSENSGDGSTKTGGSKAANTADQTGGAKQTRTTKASGGGKATTTSRRTKASGGSRATATDQTTGGANRTSGSKDTTATGGRRASTKGTGGSGATTSGKATGGGSATDSSSSSTGKANTVAKFVGNITTSYSNNVDTGGKTFSKYWDQITPENAGKWGSVQSNAGGGFNWGSLDAIYDYAQKNNIIFKQHAFIWGTQQPGGSPTQAQIQNWMQQFCKRYPKTKLIDVVNEPPPHTTPNYVNNMGGGTNGDWKWIANAFIWARAACPDAILLLNDFNNIEWPDDNNRIINIVKKIKAQNAPIDAIGCQAHDLDYGGSINLSSVKKMAEKLHTETGLPLYITEMDISTTDDNAQLTAYKNFIPYFLETEWIHGITIWGWIYGQTWASAPNSGLVRNGSFRPAMTWLMQTLGRPTS